MIWIMIILMALIIFASRYLFLEPRLPVRLGQRGQRFLSYSAPAVLTAIFAPIVFIRGDALSLGINNPYLVCAVVATGLVLLTRNTLLTTVVSMGLFFVIN